MESMPHKESSMTVATRSSEEIKKDVVDQLYWDGRVDAAGIEVKVVDGTVRLNGTVPTYSARRAAEEDAWQVAGVKSVENGLTVAYPGEVPVPADEEIGATLASVLSWDSDLENADIDVTVQGGWVTLRGTVDAYWKRRRAEDLAATFTGVQGVRDELAVVPSGIYEDKLIADSIVAALERNINGDVESLSVQVNGGQVTLTGSVSDLPAFRAAQEAAEYTPGVVAVNNELTIR
jgi:hyperosmotically inducible protein